MPVSPTSLFESFSLICSCFHKNLVYFEIFETEGGCSPAVVSKILCENLVEPLTLTTKLTLPCLTA